MSSVNDRSGYLSGHPSDGEWLRFADGEVTGREEKQLRAHLAACWQCRAALEETQKAVNACVEYKEVVLKAGYPAPPEPWFDIYREFERIEEKTAGQTWFARFSNWMTAAWTVRRTSYAAIATTLVALLVWQSWQLPAVQAASLLRRAVASAESRPAKVRRVRIKTKSATLTRVIGSPLQATQNKDLEPIEALFRQANYDWDDPLSARTFQRWRSQLSSRHDELTSTMDAAAPESRYHRIRTTTESGELIAASLTLRASDLEPTSGLLEFRNHEPIEIQAVAAEQLPAADSTSVVSGVGTPQPSALPPGPEAPAQPATLHDELLVFKALRGIGADLDQPLEVTRNGPAVEVTGVAVPAERRQELHAALDALPRVRLQFNDAGSVSAAQLERHLSNSGNSISPEIEQLQGRLETALGGRAAFTNVADRALESGDDLMARMHALRRLAERYPTNIENSMTGEERSLLAGLRHDHAAAVLAQAATLQKLLAPALRKVAPRVDARPATALGAGPWQSATEQLFNTSRQVDLLLAGALAATPAARPAESIPGDLLARLADLMVQAESYEKMAREVQ
ncbi:zf-HC2 domain-containing protein [Paludibaculum fermentans]|uniref:zf-HC2 domain-containing protein n=1 Tax=Paludibaculum fermentans TaxID=1473598 RepID=UPI003EBAADA2